MNWRATARRGEPWVNETHPERNSDIVIFIDTFSEARRPDLGTLDVSIRAAASLAALYLREKDRVGLVSFGGVLNWLTVTSGTTQLYRIVDSLLDAEILLSYAWKDLDVIPPRLLPIYAHAEDAYGVPSNVLAAINKVETDFGRNLGPSAAGAVGWMQFLPSTWKKWGVKRTALRRSKAGSTSKPWASRSPR